MTQSTDTQRIQDKMIGSVDAVMARADRLFDTARPEAVFAAPVAVDGRTVIGTAEVLIAAGFGGGGGFSPGRADEDAATPVDETDTNAGGGGGGGGYAQSRPVAVVIIDANGARVEPVVDVTKLGLAALTVFGSMLFMFGRMWRGSKGG